MKTGDAKLWVYSHTSGHDCQVAENNEPFPAQCSQILGALIKEENLMAPNFISKITILSLTLALCVAAIPAPALAAAPADFSSLKIHVIKFYFDPALVPDMEFAKAVLPKYVSDMNTILAKNTNRQFVFDPETGIILTGTKPQSDSARPPLPTDGFEIWVYAVHTNSFNSYGGYMGMDKSGAGVLAGFSWTRLYDPDNLAAGEVLDYATQIDHMLHELAHVFGGGIGEYYNLAHVMDTTAAPFLDINLNNSSDSFWNDKPDFMADPLLRFTRAATRAEYVAAVRYSNLTAAIINGDFRNGIASFAQFTVQVLGVEGRPTTGANVKVWSVSGTSPYLSTLLFDGVTDENGDVVVAWGAAGDPHNSDNFLRLIKVYQDGVSITQPRYVSIYDADIAKLVSQSDSYKVTLNTLPAQPAQRTTISHTMALVSTGAYDGWVLAGSKANGVGGSVNSAAVTFLVGDNAANRQYRSILSFDTSALPDNAVITGATLKIRKQGQVGVNPFAALGTIQVDIRSGAFSNFLALQAADFQAAAGAGSAGQILNSPDADNWYSTTLDASAFSSVNLSGATQLRLRFNRNTDNDKVADNIKFFSGNAPAGSQPVLTIQYYVP